ncbi:MAG: 4Fe-4S dicluster domain-containing protein [Mariprofundaceae bacterium]
MMRFDRARRRAIGWLLRGLAWLLAVTGAGRLFLPGSRAEAAARAHPIDGYDWHAHQWAFGIDVERCIGCNRCVEACKTENNVPGDPWHFRTWIERYRYHAGSLEPTIDSHGDEANIRASQQAGYLRFARRPDVATDQAFFVPKLCNHCERPACVQVCPTGATFRTPDGVVLVDREYCIGCQYCIQACPYGARFLNPELRVADKCTWCYHRITRGMQPACVEVCPTGARIFGDLNDPDSPISRFLRTHRVQVLKPETGNRPRVFYHALDRGVR